MAREVDRSSARASSTTALRTAARRASRWAPCGALLALVACVRISTGDGTDAGPTTASTSTSTVETDGGAGATGCAVDPTTQVVLCEAVDACPTVFVDPGAFPNCGFRIASGMSLDLECLCGDSICPIGVPTSCAQAQALLDAQSALVVCEQVDEQRCVTLIGSSTTTSSGTCDKTCEAECAGDPSCYQFCGC